MNMNDDMTVFTSPELTDDDYETVHRLWCYHCGTSTLLTDQEYRTSLVPLDKLKCNCGRVLIHSTVYQKKSWVDKNLRGIGK